MWLFTETGFVSAVVDLQDKKKMIVRGRDKTSLQPLAKFAGVKVLSTPERDYPFRVFVSKQKFGAWVSEGIASMEYNNYKGRMYSTRPNFSNALHDVWEVMHAVEQGSPLRSRIFG